jgi:hypothetical protein
MNKIEKSLTFQELLDCCSNQASPYWEYGWGIFIKRYKMYIYKNVTKCCLSWNVPRLKKQLSEAVNDVVSDVLLTLCRNDCQAIHDFRARDNEKKFFPWLATICNRVTGRYMHHYFTAAFINAEIDDIKEYFADLEFDVRWELYEFIIQKLRSSSTIKKRNLERDINIFQLYTWADFSSPMIATHPCLKNIGHRVVDNVINRMRDSLRSEKNF